MSKSTAPTKVRRRSAGEGSVYETERGWRGAVTWTTRTAPGTVGSSPD